MSLVRLPRVLGPLVVALAASCGDADPPEVAADAGADDASATTPPVPALPMLAPCPAGWREVPGEPATCDPWPATGPTDCPADDEAHFPGEPACARIGTDCPPDGVPANLPADQPVLHVRAGATDGDGTVAAPFGTVTEGNSAAGTSTIVAIAAGTYDEVILARAGVTFRGACVADTTLTSSTPGRVQTDGLVSVNRDGVVTLENLRIADAVRTAVGAGARRATVVLSDVAIVRVGPVGVAAVMADVDASSAIFRDIQPAPDGSTGRAVVSLLGDLTLARVVVERAREIAVTGEGPRASLTDVAIRDAVLSEGLGTGRGAQLAPYDDLELERVVVEDAYDVGVFVLATLGRIDDVVVRRISSDAMGRGGRGLEAVLASNLAVRQVLVEDVADTGVNFTDGPRARVEDLVVRRSSGRALDGQRGRGLNVQVGTVVDMSRLVLSELREGGVVLNNEGTVLRLTDATITDMLPRACATSTCPDDPRGTALGSFRAAWLEVSRFVVARADLCGVHIGLDGEVDLGDGEIRGTEIGACVQVDGYDYDRLTRGVSYRDNRMNLDATTLPIPDAL
jgi:hypothetical protein